MSLVVGFFCLFFSIWGAKKLTEVKFECNKLTGTGSTDNITNCATVGYCYWDYSSGSGACVKDTCLETKDDVTVDPDEAYGGTNPCTDTANGCTVAKFTAIGQDATGCADNKWRVYCAHAGNNARFDQCTYNFINSDGQCSNDNCKSYKYGITVWDAATAVAGEDICRSTYINQICNETYGVQNCYLNPSCMIDNGQCVVDRCTDEAQAQTTSCDDAQATNGQKKCKQYRAYYPKDITKFESDTMPICYYSGEKYPGSNYPYANPCFILPIVAAYTDTEDLPSGQSHRCQLDVCTNLYIKDCQQKNISKVCTSADVLGGISCKVLSSSIIGGEFCSDGRNDYVAPVAPEETPCGAASVLRSPCSLVMLLLVAFLVMLFN